MPARNDVTCVHAQAAFYQRPAVAFEAFGGDSHFGTAQVANAAASSRDQMLCRQSADRVVIDPNEGCLQPSDGAVNQHKGDVAP